MSAERLGVPGPQEVFLSCGDETGVFGRQQTPSCSLTEDLGGATFTVIMEFLLLVDMDLMGRNSHITGFFN